MITLLMPFVLKGGACRGEERGEDCCATIVRQGRRRRLHRCSIVSYGNDCIVVTRAMLVLLLLMPFVSAAHDEDCYATIVCQERSVACTGRLCDYSGAV